MREREWKGEGEGDELKQFQGENLFKVPVIDKKTGQAVGGEWIEVKGKN